MTIEKVLEMKVGDKIIDTLTGEVLAFYKYDKHDDNHVLCSGAKGETVWLMPNRIERWHEGE